MQSKINWDALGISASLACAVHCALLPLFLTSLPVFGVNIISNLVFEVGMVVLAFAIGSYSLYHGFQKHHRSFVPVVVFLVGFLFLVLKLFFVQYEAWLVIPAVAGIVAAHLLNYRSCRISSQAHTKNGSK